MSDTPTAPPRPADLETRLLALAAKQEIHDVLARYLRAVDRGDVEGLRACYLPGATEDHGGVFEGPADEYVASIADNLTHPRAVTTHAMTNVLIEVDGTRARAESYVLAFARVRRPDGEVGDTLTSARMIDALAYEDGRWGIAHRALRWDWNHDMERSEGWVFGMLVDRDRMKKSAKYPDDVVYADALTGAGA